MPTARSYGCLATVGNNLFYSGASSSAAFPQMQAVEMIVGKAVATPAPTAAPTSVAFEPWTTKRRLPVDVSDGEYSCAAVGTYYYQYAGSPSTASGGAMVKYATATDVWATGAL
jgi:hypothetical protein